jgi:hypothetical protein
LIGGKIAAAKAITYYSPVPKLVQDSASSYKWPKFTPVWHKNAHVALTCTCPDKVGDTLFPIKSELFNAFCATLVRILAHYAIEPES